MSGPGDRPALPPGKHLALRGLPGNAQLRSDIGDRAACGHPADDQASSMNCQSGINVRHEDLRAQSV